MTTILLDQDVEIPLIRTLQEFRQWALSEQFPQRGRIDYIGGRVEVDTSPEDVFTHGTLKTEVAARIADRVNQLDLGHTLVADTRISSPSADLSAEPDIVVFTHDSLDRYAAQDASSDTHQQPHNGGAHSAPARSGAGQWGPRERRAGVRGGAPDNPDKSRVRLIPKASGEPDRYVEVEGGPDLVVEIVSDSSEQKDTRRLLQAYFKAGVRELWLIDARGPELLFQIQRRGADAFVATEADTRGSQPSEVLSAAYRLERTRHARGHWVYRLRSTGTP
jgi:Uma2 family endonuclease